MEHSLAAQPSPFAGFWRRFLACVIDQLLLGVFVGALAVPIFLIGIAGATNPSASSEDSTLLALLLSGMALVLVLFSIVINWLYSAIMEASMKQATLGKMAVGIIVTDMSGGRISFGRATGRHFAKILSLLLLCIGYAMAGFTQQKQALHDILAQCLVVNR